MFTFDISLHLTGPPLGIHQRMNIDVLSLQAAHLR